jgi:hypothetical protein
VSARVWTAADLLPWGRGMQAFLRDVTERDGRRTRIGPARFWAVPERPGIRFAPGMRYREAVTALYFAREQGEALPPGARIAPPLPRGTTILVLDGRITVDSAAPMGYAVTLGTLNQPHFSMPGHLTNAELSERFAEAQRLGLILPRDGKLLLNPIERCQVVLGADDGAAAMTCEHPRADLRLLDVSDLPLRWIPHQEADGPGGPPTA